MASRCSWPWRPGGAESADAWKDLLDDLAGRGLCSPLLVISDGGSGLGPAIERAYPASLHQRCLAHVCRNVIAKVPVHAQADVKRDFWAVFDDIEADGAAAEAGARRRAARFIAKYKPLYPAAAACAQNNSGQLVAYLRFPREHQSGSAAPT